MDQSITERPQTEAEKLLAHHPSTKALAIHMTETPFSSQVAAHGYNLANQTLRVRFKWGNSEYDYHRVPPEVAAEFAAAKSKGGFLKSNIKGIYHYECVKEREASDSRARGTTRTDLNAPFPAGLGPNPNRQEKSAY